MTATLQRRLLPAATDRAFRTLVAEAGSDVRALVSALVAGDLSPSEWADQMQETLAGAHAEAAYRGRVRAGDTVPFERDDLRFGALVAQEEAQYLWGFQRDLEAGRYGEQALDGAAIGRRAALYVARLYGTANEALTLADGGGVSWVLGDADHCRDCVRLAAGSPYAPGALNVYPRSGATQCLANCACELVLASGERGFAP